MGASESVPITYSVVVDSSQISDAISSIEDTEGIDGPLSLADQSSLVSPTRRNPTHSRKLILESQEWATAWEMFQQGVSISRDRPCMGQRLLKEDGSKGEYEWLTYSQVERMALQIGTTLVRSGLCPEREYLDEAFKPAQHLRPIGVFARNSVEWLVLDQACNAFGFTLVPLYDTLGDEALVCIAEQTKMPCIVVSPECFSKLESVLPQMESVQNVILLDTQPWACTALPSMADPQRRKHNEWLRTLLKNFPDVAALLSSTEASTEAPSNALNSIEENQTATTDKKIVKKESLIESPMKLIHMSSLRCSEDFLKKTSKPDESGVISAVLQAALSMEEFPPESPMNRLGSPMNRLVKEMSLNIGAIEEETCTGSSKSAPQLLLWSILLQQGSCSTESAHSIDPDTVQTLCFTSGTTGLPKGVIVTHRAFMTNVSGVMEGGFRGFENEINKNDVHFSYLPLAHFYERLMTNVLYASGASLGFQSGTIHTLFEDISMLKPTLFIAVPRVYSKVLSQVENKMAASNAGIQKLYEMGVAAKLENLESGCTTHAIWDPIIFNRMKQVFGGRVRYFVTGGAALDSHIEQMIQVLFCAPMIQGYGLTETLGAAFVTRLRDGSTGHVGGVLPWAEYRLEAVEEMKMDPLGNPPRGEILIRGAGLSKGYFRNANLTNEVFDQDGWFHTGDIGQQLDNGAVKIIDRRKNIFKLSQGEYVAPEKIEGVYSKAHLVSQSFVFGYSDKDYLIGIVVPEPTAAEAWARSEGLEDTSMESLVANEKFQKAVEDAMEVEATNAKLKGFEKVKSVRLVPTPFTSENGLLTPTMKPKRNAVKERYEGLINEIYI